MGNSILVPLSDYAFKQIHEEAQRRQESVEQVVANFIEERFAGGPTLQDDAQMLEEMAVFEAMHAQLLHDYLGQWVAIYQGKLVDADFDIDMLTDRLEENYPHQVVMVDLVEPTIRREFHFRSPRLISEE